MNVIACRNTAVLLGTLLFPPLSLLAQTPATAHDTGASHVHFQKPNVPGRSTGAAEIQFHGAELPAEQPARPAAPPAANNPLRAKGLPAVSAKSLRSVAKPLPAPASQPVAQQAASQAEAYARPAFLDDQSEFEVAPTPDYRRQSVANRRIQQASFVPPLLLPHAQVFGHCAGCDEPSCGVMEPECGIAEPGCGIAEPGCGIVEPGCGIAEPSCEMMEPGCGIAEPQCGVAEPGCGFEEPTCGVADVDCGSCVGRTGPDYWCFPVCLPRFKELSFWGGVHGFKGPRDGANDAPGDCNFGFQEGINIGGRAPLVGLLFPQLSYQLGYQAVQSQLSGNSGGGTNSRNQDFVTAAIFRRVSSGLQFGVAWDYQNDDLQGLDANFSQIRYEASLKGRSGREVGFWGANHVNNELVGGTVFQSVDQYAAFFRWNFRDGGSLRFWGGGTNDHEGLFGGDFYAPLNSRWSLQTGFNYLITDQAKGRVAAGEESWNLGMNLVWHYGNTAKKARYNPFMPLFQTADNGWMFTDAKP